MTKKIVCCALYLRKHISYDCHLWYTCVKWWYLQIFLLFFWNFDFQGYLRGKRAKIGPKWEKILSVVLYISGTIHMIFIYVTYVQMIISPSILFIFSKFWFSELSGDKTVKASPKWRKILSVALHISGTIVICGTQV